MSDVASVVGRKPWAERLATLALFAAHGFGIGAWAATIPFLKARFSLTDGSLSYVLLAMAVGGVLAMPPAGLVTQRLGSGTATRLMGLWLATTLMLPVTAPTPALLALACFLLGTAVGGLDVTMNVHASTVEQRWGSAIMSSFHAGWSIGALLGATVSSAVLALGVQASWLLPSAGLLVAALTLAAYSTLSDVSAATRGPMFSLPTRAAVPLCLAVLLALLCEHAVIDWSNVYLTTKAAATPALGATGFAVFAGAMLVSRIFGDTVVRAVGRPRVVQLGAIMAACGLLLVAALPMQLTCLIGFAIAGFGLANAVPALFSAVGSLQASPGVGVAMAATSGYTGFMIGPPILGGIAANFGLQAAMAFAALCTAAIAILSLGMSRSAPAAA